MSYDLLTQPRLLESISMAVAERRKQRVVFCNVSTVVQAQDNLVLRDAVNTAQMVSPDGMPLVWVARLKGYREVGRCDGPSFMRAAMEHGTRHGWRHYLYGASETVIEALQRNLTSEIDGLHLVGAESPPYRPLSMGEELAVVDRINAANPDLVWVGLGMPKQEIWMAQMQEALNAPVLLGVGAAFDFHAGARKRAPVWMQRSGLEWLHRFGQEPGRLWRRYLHGNTRFMMYAMKDISASQLRRIRRRS